MTENTNIEWADHTFNPWIGCTKVSPACDHCYAERVAKRMQIQWGVGQVRKRTKPSNWQQPQRWHRHATLYGQRPRVFCASLADVFDNEVPSEWREDLFALIRATPHLDWLLLTKRIGNAASMLPRDWGYGYPNAWLGATVVTQEEAARDVPKLLNVPARVRFMSCEPLLGELNLEPWLVPVVGRGAGSMNVRIERPALDWVITGGESGPKARPMHPDWVRSLRDQCQAAGVPFHFKQWGEWVPLNRDDAEEFGGLDTRYGEFHGGQDFVECCLCTAGDRPTLYRLGKKAAGRSLDGRTWDEVPT